MAGFVVTNEPETSYQFHIDTLNVAERIRLATNKARVITLQLDGDELDAALWGLENFKKAPR